MSVFPNIFIPAGSFRCDKLVKSSLASNIAGFISGGKELLSDCNSLNVVLISLFCHVVNIATPTVSIVTHLAILQLEYDNHIISHHLLRCHLGGNPALRRVGLPGSCANIVIVYHDTWIFLCTILRTGDRYAKLPGSQSR